MRERVASLIIGGMLALFLCSIFFPYAFDSKQSEYHQQCIDRYMNNTSPIMPMMSVMSCTIGQQYPERLPDPERNITIKSIKPLWFGDCKVLLDNGEMLHSSDDKICMALPQEQLHVKQRRTIENEITSNIYGA